MHDNLATYEFIGEKYKKASKHQKERGNKLMAELNEKIFDLGCGDGALTEQLSSLIPNGNILGINVSYRMIQLLKALKKII